MFVGIHPWEIFEVVFYSTVAGPQSTTLPKNGISHFLSSKPAIFIKRALSQILIWDFFKLSEQLFS